MNNQELQNKETENFLIPIDGLFSDFLQHINIENNSRIFFSGKFGIGKTFFLHEFFKRHNEKYEIFHLFPVNYQISSNEDVIELLKYDILIELLKRNPEIFQYNKADGIKEQVLLFCSFCREKGSLNGFLRSFLSCGESVAAVVPEPNFALLTKLGRPLDDLLKFDEEFQKFKKQYETGERGIVEEYINEITKIDVQETDYLSYLLSQKIKEKKASKQSVLILDDLDRIDPEHIFRILNVFSAHFNLRDDGSNLPNKFGFDKIILVGDKRNIESIFHHRYGTETDFDGYFDKFTSYKVCDFENEKIVTDSIDLLISQFGCQEGKNLSAMQESGFVKIILGLLLKDAYLLDSKEKLNLRQLLKLSKFNLPLLSDSNYPRHGSFSSRSNNIVGFINFSIKALVTIYSGEKKLMSSLLKMKEIPYDSKNGAKNYYSFLSQYLWEVIENRSFDELKGVERWNKKYMISRDEENPINKLKVDSSNSETTKQLFYDLLIAYITEGKHNQRQEEW